MAVDRKGKSCWKSWGWFVTTPLRSCRNERPQSNLLYLRFICKTSHVPLEFLIPDPVHPGRHQREAQHFHFCCLQLVLLALSGHPHVWQDGTMAVSGVGTYTHLWLLVLTFERCRRGFVSLSWHHKELVSWPGGFSTPSLESEVSVEVLSLNFWAVHWHIIVKKNIWQCKFWILSNMQPHILEL